jgi:hypothetical protein
MNRSSLIGFARRETELPCTRPSHDVGIIALMRSMFRPILCACLATGTAVPLPAVGVPALARRAASAKGFVPKGWTLETLLKGDLDGDGKPDLAFLLSQRRRASPTDDDPGFLTRQRILGVALADGNGYRLAVWNPDFIPAMDNPNVDDPVGVFAIENGELRLTKHFWTSRGSWWSSDEDHAFRYQTGCMRLVRYHGTSVHRGTGVVTETSSDLRTGLASRKVSMVDGAAPSVPEDGDTGDSTWNSKSSPPVCLDTLKEWSPPGP